MYGAIKAVIFDMDGVLINSEPLWRKAMVKGFTAAGIDFTEADCRKTTGQRINEVVNYWLTQHRANSISPAQLERNIIEELLMLIEQEGDAINGITNLLALCEYKKLPTGLATSSSNELVKAVLKKLNLQNHFKAVTSAEFLKYGKPHPEVFLNCAGHLEIPAINCVVVEDSVNGIIAAKAAQMRAIAVPDEEHFNLPGFNVADHTCKNMHEALNVLESML